MGNIKNIDQSKKLAVLRWNVLWVITILAVVLTGLSTFLIITRLSADDKHNAPYSELTSASDRPYIGRYVSNDEYDGLNYIEIYASGKYLRSFNYCEGYYTIEGNYSAEEIRGQTRITFSNSFVLETNEPYEENALFFYIVDQQEQWLDLQQNENDIYSFFDCSYAIRFIKQ